MAEWRYSSTILHLCTRWRYVVSFKSLPLYRRYPPDRRLGGQRSCEVERNVLHLPGIELQPSTP
jgi:hypothetical protein